MADHLRIDTASLIIAAPAETIYRAFTDREALLAWLPPHGMTGELLEFEPRPGGAFRMALHYAAPGHGKTTADGGTFDRTALTAAHPTLAFGTVVRVTNLSNGRMVKVEINDRGPRAKGRIIDLSVAAARILGMEKSGIARVRLEAFRADQPMEN